MNIKKLASLAKLKIDKKQENYFARQFEETLKIVNQFKDLDTSKISEVHPVTENKNILREDKVDPSRILTQDEALSNTKVKHNGFFVVDAILDQ